MMRISLTLFFAIIVSAVAVGAFRFEKFESGKESLDSRKRYCEWISHKNMTATRKSPMDPTINDHQNMASLNTQVMDRVWETSDSLKPYTTRRVQFIELPQSIERQLKNETAITQRELAQVQESIKLLKQKKRQQKGSAKNKDTVREDTNQSVEQVIFWRQNEEIPRQIEILESKETQLKNDLKYFESAQLTHQEFYSLMIKGSKTSIPLALFIQLDEGFFSDEIQLWPVWKNSDDTFKKASDRPLLTLEDSMVTDDFKSSLKEGRLPSIYQVYSWLTLASDNMTLSQAFQKIEVEVKPDGFLVTGNSFTNRNPSLNASLDEKKQKVVDGSYTSLSSLAVDALLDLSCLQKSLWISKLLDRTNSVAKAAPTDPSQKTHTKTSLNSISKETYRLLRALSYDQFAKPNYSLIDKERRLPANL